MHPETPLDLHREVGVSYCEMIAPLKHHLLRMIVHRPTHWFIELFRSIAASAIAAAGDYALLILLVEAAAMRALEASVFGIVLGHLVTYIINTLWIFPGVDHGYHKTQFVLFIVAGASGMAIHTALMYLFSVRLGVYYVLAKTISVTAMFLWGFLMRRLIHLYLKHRRRKAA